MNTLYKGQLALRADGDDFDAELEEERAKAFAIMRRGRLTIRSVPV